MGSTEDIHSSAAHSWLERSDRPISQLLTRIFVLIALAGIVGFVDSLGPSRIVLVVALLGAVVTSLLIENYAPVHLVDSSLVLGDFFLAIAASYIIPSLYYPSFLVSVVGLVAVGPYIGRLVFFGLVPLFAGFSYVGYVHEIEYWYLAVIATILSYSSGTQYGSWMRVRSEVISRRIELLSRGSNALLWEYDVDQRRFTKVQGSVERLFDLSPEECVVLFGESDELTNFANAVAVENRQEKVLRLDLENDETRWFRFSGEGRIRSDGSIMVHGVAFDVTELEESREQLKRRARQDPLTGLSNRDGLNQFIVGAQAGAQHGKKRTLSVLLLDLDRFKEINDNLGHHIGDKVLQTVANRMATFTTQDVCVARLGGDEFAIALLAETPEVAQREACEVAGQITDYNDQPLVIEGFRMPISISIGVSVGPISDWIMLLRQADSSMYQAKRSGQGFVVHDEANLMEKLVTSDETKPPPLQPNYPQKRASN